MNVRLTVNGVAHHIDVAPHHSLLEVVRDQLALTGTKECCSEGECGACTVVFNGEIVNSCLVPMAQVEGAEITTIEGVTLADGRLNRVQQAFVEFGGAQCGICTPGMVLAAMNLLERNPHPSESEIRDGLAGNLCRCTGYMKIFEAVLHACESRKEDTLPNSG